MKNQFVQTFNVMLFKNTIREIPLLYKFYRKLIFPVFLNKDLNIELLRNFSFQISLDVGANVGTYAIELQKISKKVLCFEPIKRNTKYLKLLLDNNTKCFNYALGDKNINKFIKIPFINQNQYDYALSSITNNFDHFKLEKISVKRFDSIFFKKQLIKKIEFIKIDVEGFEFFVLRGMKSILNKISPILLIEIEKRHNKNYQKVLNYLWSLGYQTYYTKNGKNLDFLTKKKTKKLIESTTLNNFWFIRN